MKRLVGLTLALALAFGIAIAAFVEPFGLPKAHSGSAPAMVYAKENGKKYHNQDCRDLQGVRASEIISLNRDAAEVAGLVACRNPKCFPR